MVNTRHIDKNGLSFDCPDYYDIGKYHSSDDNHKSIVALSKHDRKCEIYITVYRRNKFDDNAKRNTSLLERYLRLQNYNNITINKKLPYCFNARVNHHMGNIKTTIAFDFNHDDVIMVVGNVVPFSNYDCIEDIKIILDTLQYDNNIIKRVKRKITTKNKAIIGILSIIAIIFFSLIDILQYQNIILLPFLLPGIYLVVILPFILPAIFLVVPSEKINSSKFLAIISFIVFITLVFLNLYLDFTFYHFHSDYPIIFILGLLISIISLFCIFILLIPIHSQDGYHCTDKKGYVNSFKQIILYSENTDNNKNISKSKSISWIFYLVGGYLFINGITDFYYISELNHYIGELYLIFVFIIIGAICASVVFIVLTVLNIE